MGAYEVDRALASQLAQRGDAASAMVRAGLAAIAADDAVERIEALSFARRQADLALHQAVYAANGGSQGLSWRALAGSAGMPWETLYRRYHRRPEKVPPPRPPDTDEIARLL
ncbi:MAG: hypothetical protein ACRDZR_01605 [Acidimicrobiales bacterium]